MNYVGMRIPFLMLERLKMNTIRVLLVAALATTVGASADPCKLRDELLNPYRSPATATREQWRLTKDAVSALESKSCDGPRDEASRAVLFQIVEKEMTLNYGRILQDWEKQDGRPVSEGAVEGLSIFQTELLAYVDRITSPRDLPFRNTILRYGNGLAISKLGRPVVDAVVEQASHPPAALDGTIRHNAQEEAFRAIGYWLAPENNVIDAAEKQRLGRFLAGALPPDGVTGSGLQYRFTETLLRAIGNSDDGDVEAALGAWRQKHENSQGSGGSLDRIAGESLEKIRKRMKKTT